jgi:hypothetical protein
MWTPPDMRVSWSRMWSTMPATASLASYTSPAVAVPLGMIVLREPLTRLPSWVSC